MKQPISAIANINIEGFDGTDITTLSSYIENGIVGVYPDGKKYVTQRPSFTVMEDASDQGAGAKGRGIYYWRLANKLYIANDDSIYFDSYSSTPASITSGIGRVYWAELGTSLAIIDPENNEAWYFDSGSTPAYTVITAISSANFPDATNSRTLADGVAILDGTMYVLANVDDNTNAEIWGSDLYDVTSWDATNFLTASKNSDRGIYIGTHQNNVFVLGNESIEFLQNVANPTGSPLSPRQDLSYRIGCADGKSVFIDNDKVYFVSKSSSSGVGVHMMENFQLKKISTESIDSYLNTTLAIGEQSVLGSGVYVGGRLYYIITVYNTAGGTILPKETLVYNAETDIWTFWEHAASTVDEFPLVQWVTANDVHGSYIHTGKGIMANGDFVESYDDFIPQDRVRGTSVFASGVFVDGVFNDVSETGDLITMKIRVGHIDFDTFENKFMAFLRPVCDETASSNTLKIRYSDNNHKTMGNWREIDVSNSNEKLSRLGRFRSRTFDLEYTGDEALRLQGLEAEVQHESASSN